MSGEFERFQGMALPERRIVLLNEDGIRDQVVSPRSSTDFKFVFGIEEALARQILNEAFLNMSDDEIFSAFRQAVMGPVDRDRVKEEEALDEFRALRRR